jgi:chorismate lyase / 3-hydroxybenzoate synthase
MSTSLGLDYLSTDEFSAVVREKAANILGAIAFGAEPQPKPRGDYPYAWVDIPVIGGSTVFETWLSESPVVHDNTTEVSSARNDELLFGCVQMEHSGTLDDISYAAYERVFDFIDTRGYAHLLRVWNYFPAINGDAQGLERYRRFCRGRHEAFSAKGRVIGENTPAASALGSRSGPLTVYFLAANAPGERIENPRQTSAYRYPLQYGPRSPTFSRGMVMRAGAGTRLFISGTAGIVGHETQHAGNAPEQARETLANLRAVMKEAGVDPTAPTLGRLMFKAYVRNPDYVCVAQRALHEAFGQTIEVVFLQADICRTDLLLEIEGICFDA